MAFELHQVILTGEKMGLARPQPGEPQVVRGLRFPVASRPPRVFRYNSAFRSTGGEHGVRYEPFLLLRNRLQASDTARLQQEYGTQTSPWEAAFRKEMEFEYAFSKAGGLLLAGEDPTGMGGVLAGFGDQRELELLVEAGFTPLEAIHIATANGAQFLGESDRLGTIAPGKQADLALIKGDPSRKIEDVENVETVFQDGVGYDSAKLIGSVRGLVGSR